MAYNSEYRTAIYVKLAGWFMGKRRLVVQRMYVNGTGRGGSIRCTPGQDLLATHVLFLAFFVVFRLAAGLS